MAFHCVTFFEILSINFDSISIAFLYFSKFGQEFKHLVYCFEHLVDAFVVIFKQLVSTGLVLIL